MPRPILLAKGNADVRDSLHALIEDGAVRWNGLNAVLRERGGGDTVRVVHETMPRFDAVLCDTRPGTPPAFPLGAFPPAAQFATRLFDAAHDAVVLSIQAEVMHPLVRHRGDGHLLYPHDLAAWPDAERRALIADYAPVPAPDADIAMASLAAIVARVRAVREVPVLVYNLSPVLAWERIHDWRGLGETLGLRIRRCNLALIELSQAIGISIVDVETIVARGGAAAMKRDAVTLTAHGCRAVAEEVARILADVGVVR